LISEPVLDLCRIRAKAFELLFLKGVALWREVVHSMLWQTRNHSTVSVVKN